MLREIAHQFGTPCYVYFLGDLRRRVEHVRSTFGNRFHISYAVKSNPNPTILRRLRDLVDALDVSSGGEVVRAMQCGWGPGLLSFTGPGKTQAELQTAVDVGIGEVIIESIDEALLLNATAGRARRRQPILVRIAPTKVPRGFGLNMTGIPSQFGIDEEEIDDAVRTIKELSHVELCGFHIYSGTQCLKVDAIVENYRLFIDLFKRVCHEHRIAPRKLIFGAGLGIPYYDADTPIDLAAVAARTIPALDALKEDPAFAAAALVLETGRYLIGEAGIYVTRVVRVKRSRGTEIAICDGGMNHHLGAAGHLGSVVQRNYRMFKITDGDQSAAEQPYTLVGPLCTTIDTLGRQVRFAGLDAGDLIGICGSGAYGVTASPIYFISHAPPKEITVDTIDGELHSEDASQFPGPAW